jgi:hypothetical protein
VKVSGGGQGQRANDIVGNSSEEEVEMKKLILVLIALLTSLDTVAGWAQDSKYPPLSEYMMAPEAEVALAKSAAPEKVSARATVKVLTPSGYELTAQGDAPEEIHRPQKEGIAMLRPGHLLPRSQQTHSRVDGADLTQVTEAVKCQRSCCGFLS